MRQCEYDEIYDPDIGMHVEKHIYSEGMTDIFKAVGRQLFKNSKDVVKTAAKTAVTKAATSTGEYAGKKAGEKIIELLSKKETHLLQYRWNQTCLIQNQRSLNLK